MKIKLKATLVTLVLMIAACSPDEQAAKAGEKEATSASAKAFKIANDKMHKDMAVTLTGDADVDFMQSMIPHHEGAVAMAKVALEHGKDAEVRKLAEDVIKTQAAEIKQMEAWLARNGGEEPANADTAHDNHKGGE